MSPAEEEDAITTVIRENLRQPINTTHFKIWRSKFIIPIVKVKLTKKAANSYEQNKNTKKNLQKRGKRPLEFNHEGGVICWFYFRFY